MFSAPNNNVSKSLRYPKLRLILTPIPKPKADVVHNQISVDD